MDVLELAFSDLLEQLVLGLGPEGVVALQHDVQEDTHRPHIRIHWHVVLLGHDLRSHVSGCPTESVDGGRGGWLKTKPKIDEL